MKVYKILPDYERFCAFTLPMKDVLVALGKTVPTTKLMHFYKHNLSLKDAWTNISAGFEPVEGVTAERQIPDISVWVPGTLVLSNQALQALPEIGRHGELLPVSSPYGQYWVLNCLTEIQADTKNSAHVTAGDQVLDTESLQFNSEEAIRAGLFKSPFDGYRNLFCSEPWRASVIDAKLAGLVFSETLVGGFT